MQFRVAHFAQEKGQLLSIKRIYSWECLGEVPSPVIREILDNSAWERIANKV